MHVSLYDATLRDGVQGEGISFSERGKIRFVHLLDDLGIDFIDMNLLTEEIPIDWNHDTRDKGDHLNYKGACKVTTYLASYLNNTGLFTSHKEDPEFSDWVEDYKLFEEEIKHEKAA